MADGFGGAGYIDPATGQWVSTPGTGINGMPGETTTAPPNEPFEFSTVRGGPVVRYNPSVSPDGRIINTPDSSTGQPFRQSPGASTLPAPAQNQPGTLTPNSRTGAPAPGVRNLPIGGALATAASALINAPGTDQGIYDSANAANNWFDQSPFGKWLISHGITRPAQQWGPPPPNTQTQTQTAPEPQSRSAPVVPPPPSAPIDPWGPTPPAGNLPPFVRGPLPFNPSQHGARAPTVQRAPAGAGAAPGAVNPSDINLGHYRASVGNARGSTWVPGGEDAVAPQLFQGPLTMYGAGPQGAPRGAQNYYTPGSAPMAPGDWTGTGPVAPPLSNPVWGANSPQSAAAPTRVGGRGGGVPLNPDITRYRVAGVNAPMPAGGGTPLNRIPPNVYLGGTPGTMSPYGPPTKPIPPPSPNVIAAVPPRNPRFPQFGTFFGP